MYNLFQFPFDNRFPEKFCILKGNIPLNRILPQVFQNFPAYHQKFSRHKIYINLIYFYLLFCSLGLKILDLIFHLSFLKNLRDYPLSLIYTYLN